MLTLGIAVMVASVVLVVGALTLAALMSSTARSLGGRVRTAMALDSSAKDAPYPGRPAGEAGASYQWEAAYHDDAAYQAAEGGAVGYQEEAAWPPPQEGPGAYEEAAYQEEAAYEREEAYGAYPGEASYPEETPYRQAEAGPAALAREHEAPAAESPPRLLLAVLAGTAGLVLGMLIVMISSIP